MFDVAAWVQPTPPTPRIREEHSAAPAYPAPHGPTRPAPLIATTPVAATRHLPTPCHRLAGLEPDSQSPGSSPILVAPTTPTL